MKEIALDKPIARGRTAEIYDWDENHILKLFHNWFPLENVQYEWKIARAVHASGVKAPAVGELVQVEERTGLIYERVAGESMLSAFQRQPWKVLQYGRLLAELHARMHESVFLADVPAQRKRLQNKIKNAEALPEDLKPKLLNALDSLPEGDRVCHGDFHPDNVLISNGNANIIDWMDASRGNPLADVARTSVIFVGAAESAEIRNLAAKILVKLFHSIYLKQYFRRRPGGQEEHRRWLPIVAAARLNEGIKEQEAWLLQQAKRIEQVN